MYYTCKIVIIEKLVLENWKYLTFYKDIVCNVQQFVKLNSNTKFDRKHEIRLNFTIQPKFLLRSLIFG